MAAIYDCLSKFPCEAWSAACGFYLTLEVVFCILVMVTIERSNYLKLNNPGSSHCFGNSLPFDGYQAVRDFFLRNLHEPAIKKQY